jgi:hypothetical protein
MQGGLHQLVSLYTPYLSMYTYNPLVYGSHFTAYKMTSPIYDIMSILPLISYSSSLHANTFFWRNTV